MKLRVDSDIILQSLRIRPPKLCRLLRFAQALGIPALQFKQHRPQQDVIGRAGNESSFGNRADKHRSAGAVGYPAEPVTKFRVGVGRVHPGQYTSPVKLPPGNLRRKSAVYLSLQVILKRDAHSRRRTHYEAHGRLRPRPRGVTKRVPAVSPLLTVPQ